VNYVVATVKPWNLAAFRRRKPLLPGNWTLIERPEDLTAEALRRLAPRYVFFPHWSWRVPDEVLATFECVCFHMTDVPYGRGGSPLQNLILRGHAATQMTALRMVAEWDAGPVYVKRPLSLSGRAEEIFERAADLIYDMIEHLIGSDAKPVAQAGEVVEFRRRPPAESALPDGASSEQLFDFIRMLDAPTYPPAFIAWDGYRLELTHAALEDGELRARVTFKKKSGAGTP
jgi:methionyl-tRNA formyltransferase